MSKLINVPVYNSILETPGLLHIFLSIIDKEPHMLVYYMLNETGVWYSIRDS